MRLIRDRSTLYLVSHGNQLAFLSLRMAVSLLVGLALWLGL
jgi:hypothetical protein